jgi:hypothetical protein
MIISDIDSPVTNQAQCHFSTVRPMASMANACYVAGKAAVLHTSALIFSDHFCGVVSQYRLNFQSKVLTVAKQKCTLISMM